MRGGAKTWQGRRPRIPLFPGDGEVAGRKQGWAGAARGLEAASKGPGQKKGRESSQQRVRCPGSSATLTQRTQLRRGWAPAPRCFLPRPAGELAASGSPSNHARPRDPRSQPPARLPPDTHCARPQRTHRGPEGAIPAGGRQARGISGLMELGKAAVTGLAHAQPL